MRLAGARPANEHRVVRGVDELAGVQDSNQRFVDIGLGKLEPRRVTVCREARRSHLLATKNPADHDSLRGFKSGAGEMNRTPDLLITNELLYRLSYTG